MGVVSTGLVWVASWSVLCVHAATEIRAELVFASSLENDSGAVYELTFLATSEATQPGEQPTSSRSELHSPVPISY